MIDKLFNITWVLMIIALTWMNLDTVFIPVSYTHLTLPTNREV